MGKRPTNQGGEWENGQPIRAQNGTMANQSGQRMGGRLFSSPQTSLHTLLLALFFQKCLFSVSPSEVKDSPSRVHTVGTLYKL